MSKKGKPSKTKSLNKKHVLRAANFNDQQKLFKIRVKRAVQRYGAKKVTPEIIDNVTRAVKRAFTDSFNASIRNKFRVVVLVDEEKGTFTANFEERNETN